MASLIATQVRGHGCMDDLTTERRVDGQLCGPFMCLAYFSCHVIQRCLYKQALADVRSTGAGIRCLY